MYDCQIVKQFSVGGKGYNHQQTISDEGLDSVEDTIPIAWAGSLTTRTDNDTGVITMTDAGHLITTGAKVDIYWDGGQRRFMTVGTVSGVTVPIDLGSGDNLPVATTVVQVGIVKVYVVSIAGDSVSALLASIDFARGQIVLCSGTVTEELYIPIALNGAYGWTNTELITNPIAGDAITRIHISHNDTVVARSGRVAALMAL